MKDHNNMIHNIPPVYDSESRILILGSFPSVRSRLAEFYYAHPQNRFWKVLAHILNAPVPVTKEEKISLLLENHIALWDSAASCDIVGSSDAAMKNIVPNDIGHIMKNSKIHTVFCNGGRSGAIYKNGIFPKTGIEAIVLPSTSPANASYGFERLASEWQLAAIALKNGGLEK